MRKGTLDGLAGFLLGGAIGAAVGFLTAPRAGSKTRSMLNEKGQQTLEVVIDQYQNKRHQAEEMVHEIKQDLAGRSERLKEAGKKVMDRERKVLEEGAEEVKQAIST